MRTMVSCGGTPVRVRWLPAASPGGSRADHGARGSEALCMSIGPMGSCRIWRASGRLAATTLPEHFVVKTKATSSSCPSMRPPNLILPNNFPTKFHKGTDDSDIYMYSVSKTVWHLENYYSTRVHLWITPMQLASFLHHPITLKLNPVRKKKQAQ